MSCLTDELITCLATVIAGSTDGFRSLDALPSEDADLARSLIKATTAGLTQVAQDSYATNLEITESVIVAYRIWSTEQSKVHSSLRRYLAKALVTRRDHFIFARTDYPQLLLGIAPIGIAYADDPGRAFDLAQAVIAAIEDDTDAAVAAGTTAMLCAYLRIGSTFGDAVQSALEYLSVRGGDDLVKFELRFALNNGQTDDWYAADSAGGLVAAAVRVLLRLTGP